MKVFIFSTAALFAILAQTASTASIPARLGGQLGARDLAQLNARFTCSADCCQNRPAYQLYLAECITVCAADPLGMAGCIATCRKYRSFTLVRAFSMIMYPC